MKDEGIGPGALFVAFIAGAVTGATLALLFAPASGEETREYLGKRAREGREKAEALAQKGRDLVERQRETVTTAIERGREAYQQARMKQQESA